MTNIVHNDGPIIYAVELTYPGGRTIAEVPTFLGPDAAAGRAIFALAMLNLAELDDIIVLSVTPTRATSSLL